MRIQKIRIISCEYLVVTIKRLTCLVSFKDAINLKQRQREKRLAEAAAAAAAAAASSSSENADTTTNNMEEESTDSKSE